MAYEAPGGVSARFPAEDARGDDTVEAGPGQGAEKHVPLGEHTFLMPRSDVTTLPSGLWVLLIWHFFAWKAFTSTASQLEADVALASTPLLRTFRQGLVTNLLNRK